MKKLPIQFYRSTDVIETAQKLLGKIIVTNFNGQLTSARITETEAYVAITDKASHSYSGRRTERNEHMYGSAGIAYVYICYGMHHLFNVVTNKKDVPDAVLIRAAEPLMGIDIMLQRTGKIKLDNTLTKGPGNMSRALGITKQQSGIKLCSTEICIYDDGCIVDAAITGVSKRIGIDGAGTAVDYPYRFYIKGNRYVSGYPNK
jgi:DNA-3-methyladenine glycosylase